MKKYIEIFKYSLKMKMAFIADYLFSLLSYGIFILVFSQLWEYILQGKQVVGYSKAQLIWYIIVAEFVVLSSNHMYKRISDMVKNGEIANMLIKPIDFVTYIFADDMSVIIKAGINMIFGVLLGFILAGPIEITLLGVIITLIAASLSIVLGVLLQILVGLLAFYTEENRSFWLIIQKVAFLVVFTPIEFYPTWVQSMLACVPTTYMIYTPGKVLVHFEVMPSLILLGFEILAGIVLFGIVRLLYRKGVEKINVNGG